VRNRNSILFVQPDYHCSFFYRDEFRKLGWKADIFAGPSYPENLLYSKEDLLRVPCLRANRLKAIRFLNRIIKIFWWMTKFWQYRFHLYYGRPPQFIYKSLGLIHLLGKDFLLELSLSKLFGVTLIYLPSGCLDFSTKDRWQKFDNGNVCGNCGYYDRCDDEVNSLNFNRIRRYFTFGIESCTPFFSDEFKQSFRKWKVIDLSLWHPNLAVPSEHQLPNTDKIRILHSAYLTKSGRDWQGRNIKGSPFVLEAIDQLKVEGYPVEYFYVQNKPANQMRFYQVQADIVVEQLIYGWWGSTGVETMALGKPVVCYIRPSWKDFFLKTFPEYDGIPVVEADTKTIYEVLRKLVVDAEYRKNKGIESRRFAESHFDPRNNTKKLIQTLKGL
tara:strand:- start:1189 stop:2346 length:1158 start_codon:yes stop_codon:yes gene_type:complete